MCPETLVDEPVLATGTASGESARRRGRDRSAAPGGSKKLATLPLAVGILGDGAGSGPH